MNAVKLSQIERLETASILSSPKPGQRDCLKARPDGTILDGHHRIFTLRKRGIDVDALEREVIQPEREE